MPRLSDTEIKTLPPPERDVQPHHLRPGDWIFHEPSERLRRVAATPIDRGDHVETWTNEGPLKLALRQRIGIWYNNPLPPPQTDPNCPF